MKQKALTEASIEAFGKRLEEEEKSPATVQKYLRDVRAFFEYMEGEPLTRERVIRYKQLLQEQYAPSSVNTVLAALNSLFRWLNRHDCLVKTVKIQRQTFRNRDLELSREEYQRLLSAAKRQKKHRLYLLIQTICSTGIRVGELPYITLEAVRRGHATVHLKGKSRQVLLPEKLRKSLLRYAKGQGITGGSIFITRSGRPLDRSNILHDMKALSMEARVDSRKLFPHNLRHLFACLYYSLEKDISRLADVLGHASINTTRIYLSLSGAEHQRLIDRMGRMLCKSATA